MKKWELIRLCMDLWWFIENINEESPDRQGRFMELRARYRRMQLRVTDLEWLQAGGSYQTKEEEEAQ